MTAKEKSGDKAKTAALLGRLRGDREWCASRLRGLDASLAREWKDSRQKELAARERDALSLLLHVTGERISYVEALARGRGAADAGAHRTGKFSEVRAGGGEPRRMGTAEAPPGVVRLLKALARGTLTDMEPLSLL